MERRARSAWVVVVAPGGTLPGPALELTRRASPAGLPFEAASHLAWTSDDGCTALGAWCSSADTARSDPSSSPHWANRGGSVTVVTGRPRRVGSPWLAPVEAGAALLADAEREGLEQVLADSVGSFALARLEPDGSGVLVCDALGHGFIHRSEGPGVVAFASSPGLAAAATSPGSEPKRSPAGLAWLGAIPYVVGDGSGFVGTTLLPEGAVVHLRHQRHPRLSGTRAPWLPRDPHPVERPTEPTIRSVVSDRDEPRDLAAALDRVTEVVADELVASADLAGGRAVVDLTGGKDSRVVLAVALSAGLVDRCDFVTSGPEHLVDVQVARQIASVAGIDHRWGHIWPADETPYELRVRRFVEDTGGIVNLWDSKPRPHRPPQVRVSGTGGESLRSHRRIPADRATLEHLVRITTNGLLAGGHLLTPALDDHLRSTVAAEIARDPVGSSHPLDLLSTYNISHRVRRYRGPLDELEPDFRSTPLCVAPTLAAAHSLDPFLRQDEAVHHRLVLRASEELAEIPFAGPGWATGGRRSTAPDPPSGAEATPPAARDAAGSPPGPATSKGKAEPLMAAIQRQHAAARLNLLQEAFQDADPVIWDFLDESAVSEALATYAKGTTRARRQLSGAGTIALWMASGRSDG